MSVELNGSNDIMYTSAGTHINHFLDQTVNTSQEGHVKWMPNDLGKKCTVCNKKFRMIRRRHHCRGCGLLVCANCSPEKDYV
mmetsp:Transcript_36511/g.35339  ORF Transcript_36511/g.35339 Transcript_36511/m.35339 type:complete len:82 (+) Transcript_36511:713-958(+)